MKKNLLFLILILTPFLHSFGSDFSLSTGGGGLLGLDIARYTLNAEGDGGISGISVKAKQTQDITQFNCGGFLFFDATWAELTVGFQWGGNTYSEIQDAMVEPEPGRIVNKNTGTGEEMMLVFSLLGKYPFALGERFIIFPLLGLEYRIALMEWRNPDIGKEYDRTNGRVESNKDGKPLTLSMWNALWIDLGLGLDYALGSGLYVRGELLYGFRLQTAYEVDGLEQAKKMVNDTAPSLRGLTSGPMLKIALGYTFFRLGKR